MEKVREKMKIYIITQGEYSEYHIVGMTHDRQKAERWVNEYNLGKEYAFDRAEIEEYETDVFGRGDLYQYSVKRECGEVSVDLLSDIDFKYEYFYSDDGDFRLVVYAHDKEHAKKIAYDRIAKMKAEREGL